MRRTVLTLARFGGLVTLFLNNYAITQPIFWEQTNGPYGGTVWSVAINSDNEIFAGTQGGGIFRSSNRGESWMNVSNGSTARFISSIVTGQDGFILAGTEKGVLRSTNHGESWDQINNGLTEPFVATLAIAPNRYLYAGTVAENFFHTDGKVFRSVDSGKNWKDTGFRDSGVTVIAVNSRGDVFVGTDRNGLFYSTDEGSTWIRSDSGLTRTDIRAIAISPTGTIYLGAHQSIFQSTDAGRSWVWKSSGVQYTFINAISIDSIGTIYTGTDGYIFRSTNNAESWELTAASMIGSVLSLAADAGGSIYAGHQGIGILRTTDHGDSWFEKDSGLSNTLIQCVAINASGHIFAGSAYSGFFRSTDQGTNWQYIRSRFYNYTSIAITSGGVIYAGEDGGGIIRSDDNGTTWVEVNRSIAFIRSLVIDSSNNVFGGSYGGHIVRSTDGGINWTEHNIGVATAGILSLAVSPTGTIFAGTNFTGVYRSSDHGETWNVTGLDHGYINALAINQMGNIFAGSDSGIYVSTDDGANWNDSDSGLTNRYVHALLVDSLGNVFAGSNDGVFYSTDDGGYWQQCNSSVPGSIVLAFAGKTAKRLFAGTYGNGVLIDRQSTTSVLSFDVTQPIGFSLSSNYPNPFNPITTISYQLPNKGYVTLKVFDVLGREVAILVNSVEEPGFKSVNFDAHELPSGIYYYRIQAGSYIETKKLVLIK